MATKHERIVLDVARAECPAGTALEIVHGGKHPHLALIVGGRTERVAFACTPRADEGCVRNYARQGVRRALARLAA